MKVISLYHKAGKFLTNPSIGWQFGWILPIIAGMNFSGLSAQPLFEETAPSKYRIEFTDKDHNPYHIDNPGEFLSQRSLERRSRQNIPLTASDLPVTPDYVDSLRLAGAEILTISKWMNAATVRIHHDSVLNRIAALSFVKKFSSVKSDPAGQKRSVSSMGIQEILASPPPGYGPSWWQTAIHNGHLLHGRGMKGQGIIIAILDAGFYHVDQLPAFENLWTNNLILGTRDFVNPGAGLYNGHTHGMHVLSIIAGDLPGYLIGTAPEAGFWLLRSEDTDSEYIIEEDNWIAAAEFADSAGADIINSSLGYTVFDDPSQNHTYEEMNGNITRVSRAADMAASKGMLVVVSAGNQGNSGWRYISAPADADSVLAAGAIDMNRNVAYFSSRGPSSDNDVKPDVMAIGLGTYMSGYDGSIVQGNGTSLSAPVIAGLAACLWQDNPNATVMEMLSAIRESSDRYAMPDEEYGFGIPDFNLASVLLKANEEVPGFAGKVTTFPNPFRDKLYLIFNPSVDDPVHIILYDLAGKEIANYTYPAFPDRKYLLLEGEGFADLPKGVYLLKTDVSGFSQVVKMVKF